MSSDAPKSWRYARGTYLTVIACWVVYAVLSLLAPTAASARFHMTPMQLFFLRLSIIFPVNLIWLMATRGVINVKFYAQMIRGSHDAQAINTIADGLLWTLAYLILITLGNAVLPYFVNAKFFDVLIIIRDHIGPLFALIAFFVLYRGSQRLKLVANFDTWSTSTIWALIAFSIFAFFFVLEFATSPAIGTGPSRSSLAILPHELLLFTLIIPYIASWFMGILAIINISKYARQVKGNLYRQALESLVRGIAGVVFFIMVYQIIVFAARYLTEISLGMTLLIVYIILLLYGLGFLFIRTGAKKLMRIEAVQ
jgi:hypothetical protein